jgi:Rnl2 family RNA ligase
VKYGRRNDFITKEIPIKEEKMEGYFQESFYDAKNLVLKFHSKLGDLFEDLKKKYPDIISYTLYGEYFGGNWIKKDMAKQKAVQTGITYTPFHEYMVFDVTVKTPGGDVWVPATEIEGFVGKYIKTVPVYCKGTFDEVFNVNTKIDSTIPPLLGLEKVEKNLIEGMVLRPNETFFEEDQRIMLKKKNAEFQEKAPVEPAAKKAGKKEEKELPPEIAAPVDFLSAYLNKNRVESVLSKFPDVKDRNKLKKEIYDDMIKDAEKDEFKKPEGDLLKKVTA